MLFLVPPLLLLPLLAQQPVPPLPEATPRAVFASRSELVALHVSVLDRRDAFVGGLPREAFTIYEDGRPQTVSFFDNTDSPVTAGLVLDNSGSMQRIRPAVIDAAMAFAEASHPDDELFVVHFNERVWPGLPPGMRFTRDRAELRAALNRSSARGQTALFDGILDGLGRLERAAQPKKVLVVFSDGGDNASRGTFDDVMNKALAMDAVIYTIGLYDQYDSDANPKLLRKLAESTGGESFFPRRAEDVTKILERIARDIRSGYTIGYVPAGGTGAAGFRAIRVEVRPPDRRKLDVRARAGYLSGPARHR